MTQIAPRILLVIRLAADNPRCAERWLEDHIINGADLDSARADIEHAIKYNFIQRNGIGEPYAITATARGYRALEESESYGKGTA